MSIPTPAAPRAPRWRKPVIVLALIGLLGALFWSQLPPGAYPTDLTRVGAGKPALVLAFDKHYSGGMAVMEAMNAIRADYAPRVDFLVAHLGMADGQAFAHRYLASDGTVLLFSAEGELVNRLHHPANVDTLRQALDTAFGQ